MSKNRYSTPEPQTPDCQDWTPVIMNNTRKPQTQSRTGSTASATTSSASAVVAAISKPVEDDTKKTKYIAKVTSDAVRVARCEKKLTQKELAQKCNMDVSIISEIERGTCVYNATHVNKLQTILGVKIPRS